MGSIAGSIPEFAYKVGKTLFTQHKDKIERVLDAKNATEKELRDPEKLKDYFGINDAEGTWKDTFKYGDFESKTKIPLKPPSFNMLLKRAKQGEEWLRSCALYDPEPALEEQRIALNKRMNHYFKFVLAYGEDDPRSRKEAMFYYDEFVAYHAESKQLYDWLKVSKKVFPQYAKVFNGYADMFKDGENLFNQIMSVVPHPDVHVPCFTYAQYCNKMYAATNGSAKHAKAAGKMATKYEPIAWGHMSLASDWCERLAKPTLKKKVQDAAKEAGIVTSALKKHFGL